MAEPKMMDAVVVEIVPGAAKGGYPLPLAAEVFKTTTVGDAVASALTGRAPNRELGEVQQVLKVEYSDRSRLTIGDKPVDSGDPLEKYAAAMEVKEVEGRQYRRLQIRVARPQEGGLA